MKYIKDYNIFEDIRSDSESIIIKNELFELEDILLDLKDLGWKINIDYTPKRWQTKGSRYKGNDFLLVDIRKYQERNGRYSNVKSLFKFSDIKDYVFRIIEAYKKYTFKFDNLIISDTFVEIQSIGMKDLYRFDESIDLVGFRIVIFLDGKDIDLKD